MINILLIILMNLFYTNYCYCSNEPILRVGDEIELTITKLNEIGKYEIEDINKYEDNISTEYKRISWRGTKYSNVALYVRGIPVEQFAVMDRISKEPEIFIRITKIISYTRKGRGGNESQSDAFLCNFIKLSENSAKILNEFEINELMEKEKLAGLKSGTIPISTMQDAVIVLSPSEDDTYTYGLPLDGSLTGANKYYIWRGTLVGMKKDIYTCADMSFDGRLKAFALTKIKGKFTELIENKQITVVGKLTNIGKIPLKSGKDRKIAILTECYIFP